MYYCQHLIGSLFPPFSMLHPPSRYTGKYYLSQTHKPFLEYLSENSENDLFYYKIFIFDCT